MIDSELTPFVGKPIRATLSDGRVLAGTLHIDDAGSLTDRRYAIVSSPIAEGDSPTVEPIERASLIASVDDAASDPAARE